MDYYINLSGKLLPYLRVTILIASASMFCGLLAGGILAAMKLSGSYLLRKIAELYTTVIRCTPVVILLFLTYYGLPALVHFITGIDISRGSKVTFAIVALTFYSSAILSEIIRPAYLAVSKGQFEAADMIGLSTFQTVRMIILPQAFFIALPNMGNMILSLLQQSALAFLIGVVDVMGQAKVINSIDYGTHIVQIYLTVSFMYWILSVIIGRGIDAVDSRLTKMLK